ncbi:hypothetical protein [Nocardia anaemiae]|uniref:hypothetical protein n=1 Tax=Nocardia anaemiae TaxID=263910 RepID=UPI0012F51A5A|nr:hypothetical protein [Nocardia anaemiae]
MSETTCTLYENVSRLDDGRPIESVEVGKYSAKGLGEFTVGVDYRSVSNRLCFDCDFCSWVRYCLAAQIETPQPKSVVGRGNKKGMSCVYRALSKVGPHDPP